MEDKLRKMFEENCIIEKNGKKYLNELGALIICFSAISISRKIFSELGLIDNNIKKEIQ